MQVAFLAVLVSFIAFNYTFITLCKEMCNGKLAC